MLTVSDKKCVFLEREAHFKIKQKSTYFSGMPKSVRRCSSARVIFVSFKTGVFKVKKKNEQMMNSGMFHSLKLEKSVLRL